MRHRPYFIVLLAAASIHGPGRFARAAPGGDSRSPTAADLARIETDLARVQQEVRDQRQLILQLMQMHDALLKYVQMGNTAGGPAPSPPPSIGGTAASAPPRTGADMAVPGATLPAVTRATISGKVRANDPAALSEVYVYLDGPKSLVPRPTTIQIKQAAKRFVPAVSVVQVGTRVLFPNRDIVLHNVFSRTPGDAFDLGPLKSGDTPDPVVLLKPGHVEVFCNIHSRMRADVLVVPNPYWTRVHPDGSFQLSGVPLGSHRVVLWGPTISPVAQRVELTPGGATATFAADGVPQRPHLNKQGGAYGSYDE